MALAPIQAPSLEGTTITTSGTLIDIYGNRWTLSNGKVLVNDAATDDAQVKLIVFVHSLVFEQTTANLWRVEDTADFHLRWTNVSGDPRGQSPPIEDNGASPYLASVTSGGTLVDGIFHAAYQLLNGQVLRNGRVIDSTSSPDLLVNGNNGLVYEHTPQATGVPGLAVGNWRAWLGDGTAGSWVLVDGDPRGSGAATPSPPPPTSAPDMTVLDTTTGSQISVVSQPYTGPVAGLLHQYINITADSLNMTATTDGWFIHSGSGTDAIAVHGGTNVLDGGTGSNFLTGGTGSDTFFVDARNAPADIWSTMVNFHAGDTATVWGINATDFAVQWQDGQGATGFTGLTLHATNPAKPAAALTLVGFSKSDMASGRISTAFGIDTASGSSFLYIHANT